MSELIEQALQAKAQDPSFQQIAPEFIPYVQRYEEVKGAPIADHIVMMFAEGLLLDRLTELTAGLCNLIHRVILIHPDDWAKLSEFHKEMIIAHELGHCDLNRITHVVTFGPGSRKSIMTFLPVTTLDPADRDELYRELFSMMETAP